MTREELQFVSDTIKGLASLGRHETWPVVLLDDRAFGYVVSNEDKYRVETSRGIFWLRAGCMVGRRDMTQEDLDTVRRASMPFQDMPREGP